MPDLQAVASGLKSSRLRPRRQFGCLWMPPISRYFSYVLYNLDMKCELKLKCNTIYICANIHDKDTCVTV